MNLRFPEQHCSPGRCSETLRAKIRPRGTTSALRLVGVLLEEQGDEWLALRRYFSLGSMAVLYGGSLEELDPPALEVPKAVIAV